jgi:hypothetical protein
MRWHLKERKIGAASKESNGISCLGGDVVRWWFMRALSCACTGGMEIRPPTSRQDVKASGI